VVAARKVSKANPEINAFMRELLGSKYRFVVFLALVENCQPASPSH
jgi:hypothetical protein